jgi:hypothetical protein
VDHSDELGIIGETNEDGLPVIYRLVDELPGADVRNSLPWLTVISWRYDREARNGMPPVAINDRMIALERAIDEIEASSLCRHAYSRTGNGLKEFAYYITDRDRFMGAFNAAVRKHPRYPIEIEFFEDPEWADFQKVRELFKQA